MERLRIDEPTHHQRGEFRRPSLRDERHISRTGGSVVILTGELDFSIAPVVRERLLMTGEPPAIDVSGVEFVDAGIIGEFVRLAKRVAPQRVVLLAPQPHVRRMIEMLELDSLFTLL